MGNKFDDGFSELIPPTPSSQVRGIGDNKGPEWLPIGTELEDRLKAAHEKVLGRAEELRSKVRSFAKVSSGPELKRATEYVRQLQEVLTVLDSSAKIEKEPYRVAISQVAGVLGEPYDSIEAIKRATESLMNAYNQKVLREERRKREAEAAQKRAEAETARRLQVAKDAEAAEARRKADAVIAEAARKAADAKKPKAPPKAVVKAVERAEIAEAEAKDARDLVDDAHADVTRAERAAAAPAADLTRARSPNAVQSAQEFVDFRDLDRDKVDLEALRGHFSILHLQVAMRSYIDANRGAIKEDIRNRRQPLRGVEFWINQRTRVGG